MSNPIPPQENLTDEQIREREDKMKAFYEEKLPFLRLWSEHDSLCADIAESRVRRLVAERQYASAMAPPKEATVNPGPTKESK